MARTLIEKPDEEVVLPPDAASSKDILAKAIAIFDEEFDSLNLVQKLARISGFVGAIPKNGYNAFHKYHYVTEADLVGALRQLLASAGILMIPDVTDVIKEGELTTLLVEYKVTDGKESFSFRVPGSGADRGDKGIYKALTGSQKYALMKLFKVETGDDPEADTRADERAAQSEARPAPTVRRGERGGVQRGGHTTNASPIQIRRINELVRDLELSRLELLSIISEVTDLPMPILPEDDGDQGRVVLDYLKSVPSEGAGQVIERLVERIGNLKFDELSDAKSAAGYE